MNIFGNDGFRCEFGSKFMTEEFISKFAYSVSEVFQRDKPVLIARDTRASGKIIQDWIVGILISKGFKIHLAGVMPTPGLSYILANNNYSLGIMITASHNPYTDNGIKLFASDGYKLNAEIESKIEDKIINENFDLQTFNNGKKITLDNAFKNYINSISEKDLNIKSDTKILIDCSNGAYSGLKNLIDKKNISFINCEPNGNNINLGCGALHPDILLQEVINKNYDFGVSFDGDGDRAVFVSNAYGEIESEKLAILFFEVSNKKNFKVVSSEISNFALKSNLRNLNVDLIETPVGDRFIVDYVKNKNALFGFEPSGHFHFPDKTKSMDGFISLIKFFKVVETFGKKIDKKLNMLESFQRIQENINIKDIKDINLPILEKQMIPIIDKENEKLVIRQSMWDPVIRIYYDYINVNNYEKIKKNIIKKLNKQ